MQSSTFQQKSPSSTVINDSPTCDPLYDANMVPATHSNRTLVLCFDGTGDQFDSDNSNVVQFFNMLVKDKPTQQMVYYQAGIGTYTIPNWATSLMAKISKTVDMMYGSHLDAHVMAGYEFLMQNYEPGDKICLFGFSRGAYTARALAGMVQKVGIIPRCNHQQVPFAYHMYSRDDTQGWKESKDFKGTFSVDADIEFVGVWDTVSSVGFFPKRLPFTRANNSIKFFRHALALDERRVRFKPSTWQRSSKEKLEECGLKDHEMPGSFPVKFRDSHDSIDSHSSHHHDHCQPLLESQYTTSARETDVEEVWFAGHHCDVGGGSVTNHSRNSLARIPLRWMVRECFKAGTGILFRRQMFKRIGMDPETLDPLFKQPNIIYHAPDSTHECQLRPVRRSPDDKPTDPDEIYSDFVSEELEDVADAISGAHDQLEEAPFWWILEWTPQLIFYQNDKDDHDVVARKINWGHGRYVPLQNKAGVKIHRSVKIRMKAACVEEGKYWPNAKVDWEAGPTWVPELES